MPTAPLQALIADDDPALLRLLKDLLALVGVDVVAQAGNGGDAIALYERWRPQVAILDVRMPAPSGLEVLRHIRSRDRDCRIVILTEDDGFETARQSIALGATCYVRKTSSAEAIHRLLADCLAPHASECPAEP